MLFTSSMVQAVVAFTLRPVMTASVSFRKLRSTREKVPVITAPERHWNVSRCPA